MTGSQSNSHSIKWLGNGIVMEERNEPLVCKFMIMLSAGVPVFIYAPVKDYDYHAKLVSRYCELNDIPSCWSHKPDIVEVLDNGISLGGGGWIRLSSMCKSIEIYGSSTAYGKFNRDLLIKLITNEPFSIAESLTIR